MYILCNIYLSLAIVAAGGVVEITININSKNAEINETEHGNLYIIIIPQN